MDIFDTILESKGHPADRKDYGKRGKKTFSKKSRVKVYDTIAIALRRGYVGQIFSTRGAARLYVISKAGWGKKSSGRIAKGFTPGSSTPSSDWKSVKGHSVRTMKKHGKQKSKKFTQYKVEK